MHATLQSIVYSHRVSFFSHTDQFFENSMLVNNFRSSSITCTYLRFSLSYPYQLPPLFYALQGSEPDLTSLFILLLTLEKFPFKTQLKKPSLCTCNTIIFLNQFLYLQTIETTSIW